MKPSTDITDPRVVKALAHPLRWRILTLLDERTASPSELADELGAPLGNVSYHVRQLAGLGLIKLVKKTPRRGAIEHHYRAQPRRHITDQAWAEVPTIVKEATVDAILGEIGVHVSAAASAGGFTRSDAHLTRTALTLDEQGWRELAEELLAVLERVDRIEAESRERVALNGDEERSANLVMMLFDAVELPAEETTGKRGRRAADGRAAKSRRTQRATETASR